jgi:hypothetical protein
VCGLRRGGIIAGRCAAGQRNASGGNGRGEPEEWMGVHCFSIGHGGSNGLSAVLSAFADGCGVGTYNISPKILPPPFKRNFFLRITVTFSASM